MTLSTNVYIVDPVSPHELFRFAQSLLTRYDDQGRPANRQICGDKPRHDVYGEPGTWAIGNELGQGLPAILDVAYRPGGPLRTAEQAAEHDKWCEEGCTGQYHSRACWADLDLDTAYGYRNADGMGCGDLHAALVAEIGKWLDQRGIRWEWRNEFTSEVHGGEDRYDRLVDLCSGGFEAAAWFRTTVAPAIAVMAARAGEEDYR